MDGTAKSKAKAEETDTEVVDLYNINDGLFGRDGGPYLDQEQQRAQEVVNARREGRQPEFDNLPLTSGIVPVRLGELAQSHAMFRIAGQEALEGESVLAEPVTKTQNFKDEGAEARTVAAAEQEKEEREVRADEPNPSEGKAADEDNIFSQTSTPTSS